ncbi:MAG: hypothetical protein BWZ07_03028 [Alphaproteobacteria bacterium ADurb.BinA280]|nr:MAG: hypothetical protein BWZ07_03028 [Alphaproteobacteria bacterium ADurb.BinA280]
MAHVGDEAVACPVGGLGGVERLDEIGSAGSDHVFQLLPVAGQLVIVLHQLVVLLGHLRVEIDQCPRLRFVGRVAALAFGGFERVFRRYPGFDRLHLSSEGHVFIENVKDQPVGKKGQQVANGGHVPLTAGSAHATNVVAKFGVGTEVHLMMPRINAILAHQPIFGLEVENGVIDELVEQCLDTFLIALIIEHDRRRVVDQLDQPLMLFVDDGNAGDEMFVPDHQCHGQISFRYSLLLRAVRTVSSAAARSNSAICRCSGCQWLPSAGRSSGLKSLSCWADRGSSTAR